MENVEVSKDFSLTSVTGGQRDRVNYSSVEDPHHVFADPDPTISKKADPDPDPGSDFNNLIKKRYYLVL